MKLWTWQSKEFSLAEDEPVKSLENSYYCNKKSDCPTENHQKAYIKVFQKLGTDQVIWCFTNYREAAEKATINEFADTQHRLLWEIDIPENRIIWYCGAAWGTLRTGKPSMPSGIGEIHRSSQCSFAQQANNYKNKFNEFWSGKTEEELLELMFLRKPVLNLGLQNAQTPECSEAIVIHPVGKEKIIKNPLEIGKWWNSEQIYPRTNEDVNILKYIPCHNCSGR